MNSRATGDRAVTHGCRLQVLFDPARLLRLCEAVDTGMTDPDSSRTVDYLMMEVLCVFAPGHAGCERHSAMIELRSTRLWEKAKEVSGR